VTQNEYEHRLDRYETEIAELRHALEKIRTTAEAALQKIDWDNVSGWLEFEEIRDVAAETLTK